MVSTNGPDSDGAADRPPAYQTPGNNESNTAEGISDAKQSQSNQAHGTPKPIVAYLRQRSVGDIKKFTSQNLASFTVSAQDKSLILLNSATTFDEIKDVLLTQSRDKSIFPEVKEDESIIRIISVSTNHRTLWSDVVEMSPQSWEAGRMLLLTRDDAILRLDIAAVKSMKVEAAQSTEQAALLGNDAVQDDDAKKGRCVLQ